MRMAAAPLSIDSHHNNEDTKNWIDSLLPETPSPEEIYNRVEMNRLVRKVVNEFKETLSPMHQAILEGRILKSEPDTLAAVANKIERSRERVRQLEQRLRGNLFGVFKANGLTP